MAQDVAANAGLAGATAGVLAAGAAVGGIIAPVASAFKALSDPLALLGLGSDPSSIGSFQPDVTIEESGHDGAQITEHPVEVGSTISDHAFMLPAELRIRAAWSDSGSGPGFCRETYAGMLALMAARIPMKVVTGKRVYENMLIQSISQSTDQATSSALFLEISLKQVVLVKTEVAHISGAKTRNPADTAPVVSAGMRQPIAATPGQSRSILLTMQGGSGFSR